MRGKSARLLLIGAALAIAVVAGPPEAAPAFDRTGARTSDLRRDLRILRPRALRAPRAAAYELKGLQHRLDERQIEAPRDPGLPELAIETRRLRWQADRAAGRKEPGPRLPRTSALATSAPLGRPRYPDGVQTPPGRSAGDLDFGPQVVALQRDVAGIEQRLAQGEAVAAEGLLEAAEADLAVLLGAVSDTIADDPNLVALEAQLEVLRQRLQQLTRRLYPGSNTSCTFM